MIIDRLIQSMQSAVRGKGASLGLLCGILASADSAAWAAYRPIRLLLDQAPATLNPRLTVDATGQRLNMLVFAALTRILPNLDAGPDLAESWKVSEGGKRWTFRLKDGLRDHAGESITTAKMAACLEEYRSGKPTSPLKGSLPKWVSTEFTDKEVTLHLSGPDPYVARNVSLYRYFRVPGSSPCRELKDGEVPIASGRYRYETWNLAPDKEVSLIPVESGLTPLRFAFVMDDNTKAIRLIRGEVDAIQNGISLTKTDWIRNRYPNRFRVVDRDGVSVSYLAFNLRDPLMAKKDLRRAISLAIDREAIVQGKLKGYGAVAGSFLAPLLPESAPVAFPMDRTESVRLLEAMGFKPDARGIRLTLHYKCTPVREGVETALLIQDQLAHVGIHVQIDVTEPAVFIASIRKGAFQLISSRWLGVADGSILYSTLHTGQTLNRVGYSDPEIDRILDQVLTHDRLEDRKPLLAQVQKRMMEDLPYFPLWFWSTSLITKKEIAPMEGHDLSASGAFDPLTRLHFEGDTP